MKLSTDAKEDLALTLLAESVVSDLEDQRDDELSEKVLKEVARSQEDITETLKGALEHYGIDYKKHLPIKTVEKIEKHIDDIWQGHDLTFADLYDHKKSAAHRELLSALGHGIKASDDESVFKWLEDMGVDPFPTRHMNLDNDYNAAHTIVELLKEKVGSAEGKLVRGSAADDARKMVGDGKTPNKYFLSISNDFDVLMGDETQGADECIKGFKSKGDTIKAFDSYAAAKEAADDYDLGRKDVNRVTIEDRITGVVYERLKEFNPASCTVTERTHDDIGFTKEKLGPDFK